MLKAEEIDSVHELERIGIPRPLGICIVLALMDVLATAVSLTAA